MLFRSPNPAFTITYTGFRNGETSAVIDLLATATSSAVATTGVGTYPIVPSGGSDNNYVITYANGTLTITQATLTVTADNQTRAYGDVNPTLTVSYSGFKNSETSAVLTTLPTATTVAINTSIVGTYPIVPSGGVSGNYAFTYVNGTLTVTKAVLTATANNQTKVYGDANPALTIAYTGFKNGETAAVILTPPTATTIATLTSSVGTYPITLAGGLNGNYSFTLVDGTLTVTQATIVATADNKTRVYGDPNPAFTITYTGFRNGETSAVIDLLATATSSAVATTGVGTYPIVQIGRAHV